MRFSSAAHRVHLPLVTYNYLAPSQRLCRFGVGARPDEVGPLPVNPLRIGWYTDWTASRQPTRPGGITYLPIIRLAQVGPDAYESYPSGAALDALVALRRGATWIIGNEPDRINWQDGLEPHVYARAYYDLYHRIKALDPTARIAAGSIVQPTPLRLEYLDRVLESYRRLAGRPMPVDVWNIHAFILNERSCLYYPEDCWGAEVPPGLDADQGLVVDIEDNDNLDLFRSFIRAFRAWMAERGYRDRPLIITEFGVLMPEDYGFDVARVNRFMNATFDYLASAADPDLGYPPDDNRLVQRWAWYSLADEHFNGPLFRLADLRRTAFGDNFAAYTAAVAPTVNLRPLRLWVAAVQMAAIGQPVTVTLAAEIVNNGGAETPTAFTVRFYDGDPRDGGRPIGPDVWVGPLDGCAETRVVRFAWPQAPAGLRAVWVVANPDGRVAETDMGDNALSAAVLIPATRLFMPLVPGVR